MDKTFEAVAVMVLQALLLAAVAQAAFNLAVYWLGEGIMFVRSAGLDAAQRVRQRAADKAASAFKGWNGLSVQDMAIRVWEVAVSIVAFLFTKPAIREGTGEREEPKASAAGSAYEDALSTFGYTLQDEFTPEDLKDRYRTMSSKLHPDKHFMPNGKFMQMVNDAYSLIKRERGWI